jgi:hypothetical protein
LLAEGRERAREEALLTRELRIEMEEGIASMLPKVNPRDKRNSPEETPRFLAFPPPAPATTPNSERGMRGQHGMAARAGTRSFNLHFVLSNRESVSMRILD